MNPIGELIKKYINENPVVSEYMVVYPNIKEDYLDLHKYTFDSDETPLILVNKSLSLFCRGLGFSGIVITNKKIHYTCLKDSFFTGLLGKLLGEIKGSFSIETAKSIQIGEHDTCLGMAYIGHKLIINGYCIGLVRMGMGMEYDENMITYLNSLFNYIAKNVALLGNVKKGKSQAKEIDMENEFNSTRQIPQNPMTNDMQSMMQQMLQQQMVQQGMMNQQMMQQQTMQQNIMNQQMINQMKEINNSDKGRLIYIILALFFGVLGIHNFYARRIGIGFLQLLLSLTYVGLIVTFPWSILDIICVKRDGDGKKMK